MADADGSYDFNDIPKFIARLREGADFVIGSRIRGTIHQGAMPFLNRYLGTPVHLRFICLFAPTWLFLIPGAVSLLAGSIIMLGILLLDLKHFGFFTMFFAQGLIFLGRVESRFCDLPSLIKPCMRFSRTRLSDVLHCKACALVQAAVVGTL